MYFTIVLSITTKKITPIRAIKIYGDKLNSFQNLAKKFAKKVKTEGVFKLSPMLLKLNPFLIK